jgi:hypothetical protein
MIVNGGLVLNGSIFVLQACNGMVDNAKGHWTKFNGDVIVEWFQDQVEWDIHLA